MNPRRYVRSTWMLLGSMRFAVAILVIVAIAAGIGSIVPQNAGMADYVSRYGTAGADVLVWSGLTDVYHTLWFATLLIVMAASTAVCVARNLLPTLRQIRDPLDRVNRRFVEGLPARVTLVPGPKASDLLHRLVPRLRRAGYRVVVRDMADGACLVAARRGGARRIGYLLTHTAIVLITVAAFLNSDIALRARVAFGWSYVETRALPVDRVPAASVLPTGTASFRGQMTLAEGDKAEHAIVPLRDGYLVQRLPFTLRLRRFHVERYPNGQPSDFVSEVEVTRPGQTTTRHALRVNHPLTIDGVTLYQSGFADGGSTLQLSLLSQDGSANTLRTTVGGTEAVLLGNAPWTFEATDLRMENIEVGRDDNQGGALRRFLRGRARSASDLGPSITYRLRDPSGQAREMVTYLRPMTMDGARFRVSGVSGVSGGRGVKETDGTEHAAADRVGDGFRYVRIPLDPDDTATTFTRFEHALRHSTLRADAAQRTFANADRAALAARALAAFAESGRQGVEALVAASVPAAARDDATALLLAMVARTTPALAGHTVAGSDHAAVGRLLAAHEEITAAGAPLYVVGGTYVPRQASGLQVARRGGNSLLEAAMLMLALGVSLQCLVRERRFWLWWPAHGERATAGLRAQRRSLGLDAMLTAELLALVGPLADAPAVPPSHPPHGARQSGPTTSTACKPLFNHCLILHPPRE